MYLNTLLYINGAWRPSASGRTLLVVNPANGNQIGAVVCAGHPDLDRALEAVQKGFQIWRRISAFERSKIMRKAANLLRERVDSIAPLLIMEQGKTLAEVRGEVLVGADVIDWFAEEARRAYGWVIFARAEGVYQLVIKESVGPVVAFMFWNFPINQVVRKLSAALVAGCSIIVKAAEETPASSAELIRAYADAGVPVGVMNLVYGNPAEISEYLIPHPVIRKISFTGSTVVGKHFAVLAGQYMKCAMMELGGHVSVIIFDDANVEVVVKTMVFMKYRNAGQVCILSIRFLVQEGVYASFVEKFVVASRNFKVGDGLEVGIIMGALVNPCRSRAMEVNVEDAH